MNNPDTFELTPAEREGIEVARIHEWAGDPKTTAAIESIVERFPREPVSDVTVNFRSRNPTYHATGGYSRIGVEFEFPYAYTPRTFIAYLYDGGGERLGDAWRWFQRDSWMGLAWADGHGGIGNLFTSEELRGELRVGVQVQYDISKFTRYRNVGVGLLLSEEVFSEPFDLFNYLYPGAAPDPAPAPAPAPPAPPARRPPAPPALPPPAPELRAASFAHAWPSSAAMRERAILSALAAYTGPLGRKGRPQLRALRNLSDVHPPITRAERNLLWQHASDLG